MQDVRQSHKQCCVHWKNVLERGGTLPLGVSVASLVIMTRNLQSFSKGDIISTLLPKHQVFGESNRSDGLKLLGADQLHWTEPQIAPAAVTRLAIPVCWTQELASKMLFIPLAPVFYLHQCTMCFWIWTGLGDQQSCHLKYSKIQTCFYWHTDDLILEITVHGRKEINKYSKKQQLSPKVCLAAENKNYLGCSAHGRESRAPQITATVRGATNLLGSKGTSHQKGF